jgi:uncharacterized protein (TIGR00369 family)
LSQAGFRHSSNGCSVFELDADERHANPMAVHGRVLCDLADAAMGMAYASTLKDGESCTTLELKINFLQPVWKRPAARSGPVVKARQAVGLVECDVFDEHECLIARASSTCMTLRGDQALAR